MLERHDPQRRRQSTCEPLVGKGLGVLGHEGPGGTRAAPKVQACASAAELLPLELVERQAEHLDGVGDAKSAGTKPGDDRELSLSDGPAQSVGNLLNGGVSVARTYEADGNRRQLVAVLDAWDDLRGDQGRVSRELDLICDACVLEQHELDGGRVAVDLRDGVTLFLKAGDALGDLAGIEAEVDAAAVEKRVERLKARRLDDRLEPSRLHREGRIVSPCIACPRTPCVCRLIGIRQEPRLAVFHAEHGTMVATGGEGQHTFLAPASQALEKLCETNASDITLKTHEWLPAGGVGRLLTGIGGAYTWGPVGG